ncbi:MAG TPA: hypothetical protein VN112_16185 [Ensifer sp.]|nr:hypothetical protein [Ensifer sp.]
MVRIAPLIALVVLAGCQGDKASQAFSSATAARAVAVQPVRPIPIDQACTAHMGRVVPKVGEKWPVVQKRWEIVADLRDKQADDCAAWDADRKRLGAK